MAKIYGSHSVHEVRYHLVFCPKRRKACLVGDIENELRKIVHEVCSQLDIEIIAEEIMPDHVHLFVRCSPKIAPNSIVAKLKGKSSGRLRKMFPQLRKIPAMWSSSYYCGTVGDVTEQTIKRYIRNQKGA